VIGEDGRLKQTIGSIDHAENAFVAVPHPTTERRADTQQGVSGVSQFVLEALHSAAGLVKEHSRHDFIL